MALRNRNPYEKLNFPAEEAYRVLRTNIQFCGIDRKIRTLTVVSSNPGEGKTTTSINLAISMANSGMKTLLIDGDLRKSSVMKLLGARSSRGLSNYISGSSTIDEIINAAEIENLHYVGGGPIPPNPAELLGSIRFREFLKKAEEMFDIILIDTPPLGSVIDGALIASQTDGTLLVVKAKAVEYKLVQRVKEQLNKANARVIGVVLNNVARGDYRNKYYYHRYYGGKRKFFLRWSGRMDKNKTAEA